MRAAKIFALCVSLATATACVTSGPTAKFGVQEGHSSFVPARIVILGCQPWPEGARFAELPLSTAKASEFRELCDAADEFLLGGFQGQPYMKGYSPESVDESLAKVGDDDLLSLLPKLWAHRASDEASVANAPTFYSKTIVSRPEWLAWLNRLSTHVHSADAVLMPFITYAYERRYDDRGLQVAERSAAVVVLLIDTNNGSLLWAGGRDTIVSQKRLNNGNVPGDLAYPAWTEVKNRLLIEELWKEFPGRQVY